MNAQEYVKNVLVTETRDLTPVKERLQVDKNIRLIHACAGISSEIAEIIELLDNTKAGEEFDRVNLMEELGDIAWYIGIASHALDAQNEIHNYSPHKIPARERHDDDLWGTIYGQTLDLAKMAGELQDLAVKKLIFYGKKVHDGLLSSLLADIHAEVSHMLGSAGYTIEEARERNIAKLRARYGDKFTEAAALNRDLKKEREVLETK